MTSFSMSKLGLMHGLHLRPGHEITLVLALQITNALQTKQTVLDEESSSSESEKAQSSESGADHPLSGLFFFGSCNLPACVL